MKKLISKMIFKHQMKKKPFPIKLIVGAGGDRYPGWLSTEQKYFDITKEEDWEKHFRYDQPVWNQKIEKWQYEFMPVVGRILADYVFQDLDEIAVEHTLKLAYKYLVYGGKIRIAVPDMLHPDPRYVEQMKEIPHQSEWTAIKLARLMKAAGFNSTIKEGFGDAGFFHVSTWYRVDGYCKRSFWYDPRNMTMDDKFLWTCVIVDGVKQEIIQTHKKGIIKP